MYNELDTTVVMLVILVILDILDTIPGVLWAMVQIGMQHILLSLMMVYVVPSHPLHPVFVHVSLVHAH